MKVATVTNQFVIKTIEKYYSDPNFFDKKELRKEAIKWWLSNKDWMIGISVADLILIFKNNKNRSTLGRKYNEMMKGMSWSERNKLLSLSIEELKKINSEKIKTVILINEVMHMSARLAIILAAAL